jgi:hypothetical protein
MGVVRPQYLANSHCTIVKQATSESMTLSLLIEVHLYSIINQ